MSQYEIAAIGGFIAMIVVLGIIALLMDYYEKKTIPPKPNKIKPPKKPKEDYIPNAEEIESAQTYLAAELSFKDLVEQAPVGVYNFEPVETNAPIEPPVTEELLNEMTVADLREYCKNKDIPCSGLRKAELIKKILHQ